MNGWGEIRGSAVAAAATLGLLAPAAPAPAPAEAEVLYDHTPSVLGFHPTVQDFEGSLDADDTLVADDFRVPAGEVWIVQGAFVDGRKPGDAGPGVPSLVHTFLFGTAGTLRPRARSTPGI